MKATIAGLGFALVVALAAACSADSLQHRASSPSPTPATSPRCVAAGGTCVGPAAIQANPGAPCPQGLHRVDDVAIAGTEPACLGIPLGEEACCMPDAAR